MNLQLFYFWMYNNSNSHGVSQVNFKELIKDLKFFWLQTLAIISKMDPIYFPENFPIYILTWTGATGISVTLNIGRFHVFLLMQFWLKNISPTKIENSWKYVIGPCIIHTLITASDLYSPLKIPKETLVILTHAI